MNKDDIIRMAQEAGATEVDETDPQCRIGDIAFDTDELARFYRLAYAAGEQAEREACVEKTGEFARKWWSIHCASNKHMETTRKAHDDFCALQAAIRARGEKK